MNAHTEKDLLIFKTKLMEMKLKEEAQVEAIDKQIEELSENGKDEKGIDTTSYSVQFEELLHSKSRLLKHLNHVNNALLRMENNYYGFCAETGSLISRERLIAVPTTTLSMEGKRIRENKSSL